MSTTVPMDIPHRPWRRARVWVGGATAIAILATGAAVFALDGDDSGHVRAPVVTDTPAASPQPDPLIIRYGHRTPDPHDYPRVSSAAPESRVERTDDPLVIRYGQR
jgi:hypothetical protein